MHRKEGDERRDAQDEQGQSPIECQHQGQRPGEDEELAEQRRQVVGHCRTDQGDIGCQPGQDLTHPPVVYKTAGSAAAGGYTPGGGYR